MPLHDWKCDECGIEAEMFLALADMETPPTCECGAPLRIVFRKAPFGIVDIPAYQSPVDGRVINSRRQRKEDLRRNGCVEWEPGFKEETERRKAQAEAAEEKAIDATVEEFVTNLPVRKKELLDQELRAGADVQVTRL